MKHLIISISLQINVLSGKIWQLLKSYSAIFPSTSVGKERGPLQGGQFLRGGIFVKLSRIKLVEK